MKDKNNISKLSKTIAFCAFIVVKFTMREKFRKNTFNAFLNSMRTFYVVSRKV